MRTGIIQMSLRVSIHLYHPYAWSNPLDNLIDTMGPNLVHFDDSLECPERVEGSTWYTCIRHHNCCCEHWYDPALDRQRYCRGCKTWWQIACIRPDEEVPDGPDFTVVDSDDSAESDESQADLFRLDDPIQVPTILSQFSSTSWHPIVRGFHGKYDESNTWLISGSGRQVQKLKDWAAKGVPPDDWEEILGKGFLTDFLGKGWLSFSCPNCHTDI